jgi:hypothetical protein
VLKRPIAREGEARARMAALLAAHLRGYATSALQDAVDLQGGGLFGAEEAAARLVLFEKELLRAHLAALTTPDAG